MSEYTSFSLRKGNMHVSGHVQSAPFLGKKGHSIFGICADTVFYPVCHPVLVILVVLLVPSFGVVVLPLF